MTIDEAIRFLEEEGYEVRKRPEPARSKWTYAAHQRVVDFWRALSTEEKMTLGSRKRAINNAWAWARIHVLREYNLLGLNYVPDDLKKEVSERMAFWAIAYMHKHSRGPDT